MYINNLFKKKVIFYLEICIVILFGWIGLRENSYQKPNNLIEEKTISIYHEFKPVIFPEDKLDPHGKVPTIPTEVNPIPEEYKEAHYIYDVLKEEGYNTHVIAGIFGNIMTECGGQTLCIEPELYSDDGWFYGICQWNYGVYGEVHGENLEYQTSYLIETIKYEFDSFEYAFNFGYEDFINLEDEQEAALKFAQIYERCDSSTYWVRQQNAIEAYEYFTNFENNT